MKTPAIKIIKTAINFELIQFGDQLSSGDYTRDETIEAVLGMDGTLTLLTYLNKPAFQFQRSDPKKVERIAQLMIEAAKLAEKYKDFLDKAEVITK